MATARSFLLIPVTLCFLLVLAAAVEQQGKATTTLLLIHGKALCKSNPSRIISNAHVQLVINNTTVSGGAGKTTSDGHILITVKLNSEQLAAVMSNSSSSSKAYVTAPPHACGAPSLPAGKVVAAEVKPIATITVSDHDDAGSVQRPTIAAIHTAGSILLAAVDEFACVAITGGLLGGSLIG
ncbi:uncharacterized protein LOC110432438 isoform X1 [Sorghum bicolor]|uniref:Uncharacterized protein n=1 Tax=Sorghum bicolor TaxID=4558 RepID=A0A1B6QG82_SORBI|nr:uncharacterized protein LOC110432438 isoform X1 [Sorghum bicolor]KXG36932.1 hypothetical protein SORBI_3002G415400 [Sorghum bicolor]|eukprot:XP_021308530.1 uncharacterized protein LOC110432438 isoform X1 [Sorghum bicolor]